MTGTDTFSMWWYLICSQRPGFTVTKRFEFFTHQKGGHAVFTYISFEGGAKSHRLEQHLIRHQHGWAIGDSNHTRHRDAPSAPCLHVGVSGLMWKFSTTQGLVLKLTTHFIPGLNSEINTHICSGHQPRPWPWAVFALEEKVLAVWSG